MTTPQRTTRVLKSGLRAEITFVTPGDKFIKTRMYVSDKASDSGDEKLSELQRQEESLGDRRWIKRGVFPEVDKLYDRLNRAISRVKRDIAVTAIREITGDETIKGKFSRTAGCSCPCSPGVILDRILYVDGRRVAQIWISEVAK